MDSININYELQIFLKNLKSFQQNVNQIDHTTLKLLLETTAVIDALVDDAEFCIKSNQSDETIELNDNYYCYQYFITCRVCHVQIRLSKEEYSAHDKSQAHKVKLAERTDKCSLRSSLIELSAICSIEAACGTINEFQNCPKMIIDSNSELESNSSTKTYRTAENEESQNEMDLIISQQNGFEVSSKQSGILSCHLSSDFAKPVISSAVGYVSLLRSQSAVPESSCSHPLEQSLRAFLHNNNVLESIESLSSEPVNINAESEEEIRKTIEEVLQKVDPKSRCYLYGSRVYGAASTSSDLNIFADIAAGYFNQRTREIRKRKRTSAKHLLEQYPYIWDEIEIRQESQFRCVMNAVYKMHPDIKCCLSFDTGIPHITSIFLKRIFEIQPICRQMVMYLKSWQEFIIYSDNTKQNLFQFSSYLMTILVITFFQIKQILPPILSLQRNLQNGNHIGEYAVFYNDPNCRRATGKLQNYLIDFFEFYSTRFDPKKHIISPYHGALIDRHIKKNDPGIKSSLNRLAGYMHNSSKTLWLDAPMCVQDIFMLQSNLTTELTAKVVQNFRKSCQISANTLRQINHIPSFSQQGSLPSFSNVVKSNGQEQPIQPVQRPVSLSVASTNHSLPSLTTSQLLSSPHPTDGLKTFFLNVATNRAMRRLSAEAVSLMENATTVNIQESLEKLIRQKIPTVKCYLQGSRVYGVATKTSDVNLYVDFDDSYYSGNDQNLDVMWQNITKIREILRENSDIWIDVDTLESTFLCYVMRAHHQLYSMQCSLTFKDGIPHKTAKFLERIFKLQPVCRQMIIYLKSWQEFIQNCDSTKQNSFHFSSYVITVLVISALQMAGILPSIESLQTKNGKQISGNNVSYRDPKYVKPSSAVQEYLKYFFKFYGNIYKPKEHVISPNQGGLVRRGVEKDDVKHEPSISTNQFYRLTGFVHSSGNKHLCVDANMYVQDIFVQNSNITYNIKAADVESFQTHLGVSEMILTQNTIAFHG